MAGEDIREGSDARKNWREINANSASLRMREREEDRSRLTIARLDKRTTDQPIDRFPFRVYTTPPARRVIADLDADWWRKFTVQHGYVNLIKTTGCEDTDGEMTTPLAITVPASTAVYYVWTQVTLSSGSVTASAIHASATPWTSYPAQSGLPGTYYGLLAKIDTLTNVATHQSIIRQFRYADIFIDSVGGGGGVTFRGDWDPAADYAVNDFVIIRGGVAAGTYICVLTAPHGTPAPNDPSLGVYWVSIARGNNLGQWA